MPFRLRGPMVPSALALTCAIALGTTACSRGHVDASTPETEAQGAPRAAVAVVSRRPLSNSITIAGEFYPYQEVELHAKVAGYLRNIKVDIGDHVRAGEVLATLDVPELNAELAGANAGVRHTRQEIQRAQEEVKRSVANHDALHSAAIRLQQASAARPGLIAQQELDDALARDRAAEAQVDAAKSDLAAQQEKLAVSQATSMQASALNDYSRIVAPFDGVVTWRYADTGALIQAGTSNSNSAPVMKIAEISTLRLRVPVPESLAAKVRVGDHADVKVDATGETIDGTVTRFTDALDRSTRTMQVELDVKNPNYKLAPGMYASVTMHLQGTNDALSAPVMAVRRENNKSSVLVLDSKNRVHQRDVRTGLETPDRVEIIAGLNEGDRIIVGNLGAYHDGEIVDPKESKLAAGAGGNE